MVAQLKKPIVRRPRLAHRRCTAVNGSATPGRLLIPGLSKDVPLKILEDGSTEERAVFQLEKLGLLNAKSRADDAAGFIRLALENMERMTGCFDGVAETCESVFLLDGLRESDDSVKGPHLGLRVEDPHVVNLSGIRAALGPTDTPLVRWFMMNLFGPSVFGPSHYAEIIGMSRWMGEDDESGVVADYKGEGMSEEEIAENVYTKAQFIEETSPWICLPRPENHAEMMPLLSAFNPDLEERFGRFIELRDSYSKGRMFVEGEDQHPRDAVVFVWEDGHASSDGYDDILNQYFQSGVTIEWAWLTPVTSSADLASIKLACQYYQSTADLATYIKRNYP